MAKLVSAQGLAVLALLVVCCVAIPGRKPYIPGPPVYDYCQTNYNTDDEIKRVQDRMASGKSLAMVQVLTRHGDRTPIEYLNSPNYNDTVTWTCNLTKLSHLDYNGQYTTQNRLYAERYMPGREAYPGNCVMGALTNRGMHQHIMNGEKYRSMYVTAAKLLPTEWDSRLLYIRSGDELRLIESAQSIMVGLYPPEDHAKEQRLPIDLIQETFDNMTPDILYQCPLGKKMYKYYHETPAWNNYTAYHNNVTDEVEDIFGTYVSTSGLADMIRCRKCHDYDYTFDGLLSDDLIEEILELDQFQFTFFPNDTASNRLGMGSFFGEMMDKFQLKVDGKSGPGVEPFSIYSGHDSSIWPFLDMLNLYDGLWPPLASNVVLELWRNNSNSKEFFIEVIYNGRSLTKYLPDCGGNDQCTWEQFKHSTRFEYITLDEFWRECNAIDKFPEFVNTYKSEQ